MNNNSNQETRLVHHVVVGVDRVNIDQTTVNTAYNAIKCGITRQAGGVVSFKCDGTWTAGSELGFYGGAIEDNVALNFIITLTPEEESGGAWKAITALIAEVVRKFDLGCHHIHTAMWIARAKHFYVMDVDTSNDNDADAGNQGAA